MIGKGVTNVNHIAINYYIKWNQVDTDTYITVVHNKDISFAR